MLDRIDIHVEVPRVEYEKLSDNRAGETSAAIHARLDPTRKLQRERFAHVVGVTCNSGAPGTLRVVRPPRAIFHRVNSVADLYAPAARRTSPENGTATVR
jgi:hypothetical protein